MNVMRVMLGDDVGVWCSELQATPANVMSYQCNVWCMMFHNDAVGGVRRPNGMQATADAEVAESSCMVYNGATGRKDLSEKILGSVGD